MEKQRENSLQDVTCYKCNNCGKTFKKPHHTWFICIECHKKDRDTIAKELSGLKWQLENVGYDERLKHKLELE